MVNAIVDMGAVPYICNSADIMIPGIVELPSAFEVNDLVVIREEKYRKALSIGQALLSSDDLREKQKGKAFKPKRPGDIKKSCLSNKKARQILKWNPQTNLIKGLFKTYQYFLP